MIEWKLKKKVCWHKILDEEYAYVPLRLPSSKIANVWPKLTVIGFQIPCARVRKIYKIEPKIHWNFTPECSYLLNLLLTSLESPHFDVSVKNLW